MGLTDATKVDTESRDDIDKAQLEIRSVLNSINLVASF